MNMRPLPIYDDRPIFEKLREFEKRVQALEEWGAFLDGFSRGTEARFNEIEKTLHTMLDTESVLHSRLEACEAKVESLTRTLDMLQELIGVEVVIYVEEEAQHV